MHQENEKLPHLFRRLDNMAVQNGVILSLRAAESQREGEWSVI
jgi:hypothetical protein